MCLLRCWKTCTSKHDAISQCYIIVLYQCVISVLYHSYIHDAKIMMRLNVTMKYSSYHENRRSGCWVTCYRDRQVRTGIRKAGHHPWWLSWLVGSLFGCRLPGRLGMRIFSWAHDGLLAVEVWIYICLNSYICLFLNIYLFGPSLDPVVLLVRLNSEKRWPVEKLSLLDILQREMWLFSSDLSRFVILPPHVNQFTSDIL